VQPSQQHQGDNSADPSAAKTGYALFDLDQTLVPWDTQLLFCNYILKRMPLRRLYLLILIPFLMLTKLLGAGGMKRVFLNYLVGLSRDELQELAAEFVEQHLPHSFYAIAEKLGFDHCFATTLEIQGRVQLFPELLGGNNKGANKIRKMRHLFPAGFDPAGDERLPNSHAFSDSHADLPMLLICEHATMVHPTEKLRLEGQKHGWQLVTPDRPTKGKLQFAIACLRQALGIYK